MKKRYFANWAFPLYVFVPGKNPHPKKKGGHMEGEKEPVCDPLNFKSPEQHEFFRYALDLYNHGYYWESHVYFEALWNAHKRTGSTADFFKAFIKLGAAGVKLSIDQELAARGHIERSLELLNSVRSEEGGFYLGFNLDSIIFQLKESLDVKPLKLIPIYPLWE